MSKPAKRLMLPLLLMIQMSLVSACVNSVSEPAICSATVALRKAHAAALVADGGDKSVVTGANLLEALKAGCGG